jgi:hypothetical protein
LTETGIRANVSEVIGDDFGVAARLEPGYGHQLAVDKGLNVDHTPTRGGE